jgi:NAD(P)-dependent dehydrogenase (short-subunit alcohol dehydrogenase family)
MRLKGKQALITGSSRGIGRGIALKLAEEGATIAVHYHRNHEAASDTLAQVRELGSDGIIVQADVCLVEDIRRVFSELHETFGTLDILVSCAGPAFIERPGLALDKSVMAFESQARALVTAIQHAAPLMPVGGRIVTMTWGPGPLEAAVRCFAVPLAARGITVNAVHSGYRRPTPADRFGSPTDVSNVVALICSDEASWITGQVIAADGGQPLIDSVVALDLQPAQSVSAVMS